MKISTRDKQWKYLLAGKALFTIKNQDTGNRFTFKVKKKEADNGRNLYFVNLLTGPDNDSDYNYLGTIFFDSDGKGDFRFTGKSVHMKNTQSYKAFKWLFDMLQAGKELPDKVEFYHEGRCGKCGRTLTVPESIESGYGPECMAMMAL